VNIAIVVLVYVGHLFSASEVDSANSKQPSTSKAIGVTAIRDIPAHSRQHTCNRWRRLPRSHIRRAAKRSLLDYAKRLSVAGALPWDGSYVYQIATELQIVSCFVFEHDEFRLLGVTILALADKKQEDATRVERKAKPG
jgi:hypothetical protein